jgi:Flp pilus assembly protein TadG
MTTTTKRRARRGFWACESGAELIEFALVFPTLLLVLGGVMDLGLLFQRYEVVTNAAREGARVAVLPDYAANLQNNVTTRVQQYFTAAGLTGTVTVLPVTTTTISAGSQCITVRTVTVQYPSQMIMLSPLFQLAGSTGTRTLTATSAMRAEIAGTGC